MSYFVIQSTMQKVEGIVLDITPELIILDTPSAEIHAVPEHFPSYISKGDRVSGNLHSYANQRVLCFLSKLPTYIIVQ